MNESLPIQWSGYPLYPCDPPGDYSKDPCTWYWYKDPDAIPERHYERYGAVKPRRSGSITLAGSGCSLARRLAVVAEGPVAVLDRARATPSRSASSTNARPSGVLRIRPSRIGPSSWVAGEPHVLVGLVDDQLHRRQLRRRDAASCSACSCDRGLELLERDRRVDQPDLGGLAARQRLAGQRVLLGLRQPEPVEPHARSGSSPRCASRACRSGVLAGDHEVRAQRHVAAAADAPAVHLGDHRLRRPPQAHELRHRAEAGDGRPRRSPCRGPSVRRW